MCDNMSKVIERINDKNRRTWVYFQRATGEYYKVSGSHRNLQVGREVVPSYRMDEHSGAEREEFSYRDGKFVVYSEHRSVKQ